MEIILKMILRFKLAVLPVLSLFSDVGHYLPIFS